MYLIPNSLIFKILGMRTKDSIDLIEVERASSYVAPPLLLDTPIVSDRQAFCLGVSFPTRGVVDRDEHRVPFTVQFTRNREIQPQCSLVLSEKELSVILKRFNERLEEEADPKVLTISVVQVIVRLVEQALVHPLSLTVLDTMLIKPSLHVDDHVFE